MWDIRVNSASRYRTLSSLTDEVTSTQLLKSATTQTHTHAHSRSVLLSSRLLNHFLPRFASRLSRFVKRRARHSLLAALLKERTQFVRYFSLRSSYETAKISLFIMIKFTATYQWFLYLNTIIPTHFTKQYMTSLFTMLHTHGFLLNSAKKTLIIWSKLARGNIWCIVNCDLAHAVLWVI